MHQDVDVHVRFAILDDLARCSEEDATVLREVLQRKIHAQEILVAESADMIVGYLRLEHLWSKLPFIGLIHVVEGRRSSGIGRRMLEFLEDTLRGRGHRLLLSSSMSDAAAAQAWHRKMGFEECGFLTGVNAEGVGEVFFRKTLGS